MVHGFHGFSVHTVEPSQLVWVTQYFFPFSSESAKKQTGKITKLHAPILKDPRQGMDVTKTKLWKF